MNIKMLTEQLAAYAPELICGENLPQIRRMKLMAAGVEVNRNDLLFGRIEDFLRFGVPVQAVNILCVGETEAVRAMVSAGVNCIVIQEHPDIYQLLNEVMEILDHSNQMETTTSLLLKRMGLDLGTQLDLSHMAEIATQLFSNPVAIFSVTGSAFVYRNPSANFPNVFDGYTAMRISQEFTAFLDRWHVRESAVPVICSGFMGNGFRVMISPISDLNDVASYLLVFEDVPFHRDFPLLASIFSTWIGEELRRGTIVLDDSNVPASQLLISLVDTEGMMNEQDVADWAEQVGVPFRGKYALVLLDISEMSYRHGTPNSVRATVTKLPDTVCTAVYQKYVLALMSLEKLEYAKLADRAQLDRLCREYHLRGGISYPFHALTDVRTAFDQALQTTVLSRSAGGSPIHWYDDYVIYDLLEKLGTDRKLENYCYPPLAEILAYDRQHNTDYAYTIYVLILSGGRQLEAAKALNIHRSTIQYRLERINNLFGLDLSDNFCLLRLCLSYGILELRGQLDPERYYRL